MAWRMGIWVLAATVLAVAARPLKTPTSHCIQQGSYCMDTLKRCCQPTVLLDDRIRHHERICFIFGQGLCQPFYEIPDVQLYVDLVRELNDTNYMELRREYRSRFDFYEESELTDAYLFSSQVVRKDRTTKSIDSREIPSQVFENNATDLKDSREIPSQVFENDATDLKDFREIPSQVFENDATELTLPKPLVATKPVTSIASKAWRRYKCHGIDCDTEA